MARRVQWRRGTSAGHDAFTGAVAEVTVDTDTGRLRVHNGSLPGGSVVAPVFDIEWHGARAGDGVSAGQKLINAAAIKEAHDAATDAGGGIVQIPPAKVFRYAEMLVVSGNGVQVCGFGINSSRLQFDPPSPSTDPGIRIGGNSLVSTLTGIALRDFSLYAGSYLTNTNSLTGIEVDGVDGNTGINDFSMSRVEVLQFRAGGLYMHDFVNQTRLLGCRITQNGTTTSHANIQTENNVNGFVMQGCRVREAGDADVKGTPVYGPGLYFEGVGYVIHGNIFEKHSSAILSLAVNQRVYGASIQGNHLEWNTDHGVRLVGVTKISGVSVQGNFIDITKATSGVHLENVDAVSVKNNQIEDESGHSASQGGVHLEANVTNSEIGPNFMYSSGTPPEHVTYGASPGSNNVVIDKPGHLMRGGVATLANSATPTVKGIEAAVTGGTTTITAFADGVLGQQLVLRSAHAVTITNGASIELAGSANFVMAVSDVLVLKMFAAGVWTEVGRSVN